MKEIDFKAALAAAKMSNEKKEEVVQALMARHGEKKGLAIFYLAQGLWILSAIEGFSKSGIPHVPETLFDGLKTCLSTLGHGALSDAGVEGEAAFDAVMAELKLLLDTMRAGEKATVLAALGELGEKRS